MPIMTSLFPPRARCVITCVIAAGVAITMTACRSTEPQQTATAAYDEAISAIEMLGTTATVVHARIQTTLDHAGTRVGQAQAAGTFLASNLISLGTDAAFIEESLEQLDQPPAPVPQRPTAQQAARSGTAEAPPPTQAPRTIVTPPAATPAPTSTQSGPRLENITMASGVNQFDCAIDVIPASRPHQLKFTWWGAPTAFPLAQPYRPVGGAQALKLSALVSIKNTRSTTIAYGSSSTKPIRHYRRFLERRDQRRWRTAGFPGSLSNRLKLREAESNSTCIHLPSAAKII